MDDEESPDKLGTETPNHVEIGGETGFEVRTLTPGTRMELRDGSQVTVVENPQDGIWVICEDESGNLEPTFCFDFARVMGTEKG
jgi:hypothetical protein